MAALTTLDTLARVRRLVETGEARRLREQAGLTMQEAARRCGGVYPSAIMHWERGTRVPRGRNLRAYGRLLAQLATLEGEQWRA
jgi:transcriptional regulator with XRE-family HTH domain